MLTDAGKRYLEIVGPALHEIDDISTRLSGPSATPLRVGVLGVFARTWLLPRLPRIGAAHPGFEVELHATAALPALRAGSVDLVIQWGEGPFEGLEAERLVDLELFPVCAPWLMRGDVAIRVPRDLAQHVWLETRGYPDTWSRWLHAAGVADIRPLRKVSFDIPQLVLDAAIDGLGVALAPDLLTRRYLDEGRLLRPFAISTKTPFALFLLSRVENRDDSRRSVFRNWLRRELDAWQAESSTHSRD